MFLKDIKYEAKMAKQNLWLLQSTSSLNSVSQRVVFFCIIGIIFGNMSVKRVHYSSPTNVQIKGCTTHANGQLVHG